MLLALVLAVLASLDGQLCAATPLSRRGVDFYNPTAGGGSMLDFAGSGGGEPLNVRITSITPFV